MATDYYALLGVPKQATEDEIKKAYRRRARELHPDANGGDAAAENRFKEVTVAYETLRDPERRRRYDTFGPDGEASGGAGFGGAGFGGGIGDIFDAFFSQTGFSGGFSTRQQRSAASRGGDAETVVDLGFEQAIFGSKEEISLRMPVACDTCGGSGARPGTSPTTCATCRGAGEVRQVRQSLLGQMVTATPCARCGGTGEEISSPCPKCRGDGRVTAAETFTVDVPAGVSDGATLRVPGRGGAGPRGGPRGDLYVHLRVRPDPRFVRDGNDLVYDLHLATTQAALGAHVVIETLDGPEELNVPHGTQTGVTFRFRGKGVPHLQARGRGDLIVRAVVDTPTELSKAEEDLLRQLASLRGEEVAPADGGLRAKLRSAFK